MGMAKEAAEYNIENYRIVNVGSRHSGVRVTTGFLTITGEDRE